MYVCVLFILAFFIRLININQSLWLDEATVAKVIHTIPFHLIPLYFSPNDFHPPLYYMCMSVWGHIFGTSEIALRMPSIIFSLISGWFVFQTASFVKNKKIGFWASAFFLFNPLIVYYSQEARMYMMATMFLSGARYYFIQMYLCVIPAKAGIQDKKNEIFFNLFSALAMCTFYGSIFFIVGMIVLAGMKIKNKNGRMMPWGLCISLLLLFPLLFQQLHNAKIGLIEVKNWSLVLGKTEIKNVVMIFLKFATGRLSWYPKWSSNLLLGIPTGIIWFIIACEMRKNRLFAYLLIFPLVCGLLVSFWAPMMMYFRFLYLIPIMSILLGVQQKNIKIGVFIIFLLFSFIYLLVPQFHRENWKAIVYDIDTTQPVYMILPSSDPVVYYNSEVSLFEMRKMERSILPEYIQVIPYVEEIYGYDHAIVLKQKGCIQKTKLEYRGPLILEKWKCPVSFIGHASIRAI